MKRFAVGIGVASAAFLLLSFCFLCFRYKNEKFLYNKKFLTNIGENVWEKSGKVLFENAKNEDLGQKEETADKKLCMLLRLECEIPDGFLKEIEKRVKREEKDVKEKSMEKDGIAVKMEGNMLVICGREEGKISSGEKEGKEGTISNGGNAENGITEVEIAQIEANGKALLREMIAVCERLTYVRPVQATIFPKRADFRKNMGDGTGTGAANNGTGKGTAQGLKTEAGGYELEVTESKNGFKADTEGTLADAEKRLKGLLGLYRKEGSEEALEMADTKRKEKRAVCAEEYYICLKVTVKAAEAEPKLSTKQAKQCDTLLARYTTYFETAGSGRVKNIVAGAMHLNGIVIYPGEEFSTAAALMPFSAENGYTEGGTYINGELSESIGGGVCQLSSTLYNALLQTDLPVTKRYAHSMPVAYVPLGRDAAIAGDYKDLCFRNTTKVPVLLLCEVEGRKVTVLLYGTKAAKRTGIRLEQVTTKETTEEVWVETYREFMDEKGVLQRERVAESRYRYPR